MASRRREKGQRRLERERERHNLNNLKRQLQHGPLAGIEPEINPPGVEKMSEALEAFAEPYMGSVASDDDLHKLYAVAIVAWNCALMDIEKRGESLEKFLAILMPGATVQETDDLRCLIEEMITRKLIYFASNPRWIVSFELKSGGDGPFLSVASTLGDAPP